MIEITKRQHLLLKRLQKAADRIQIREAPLKISKLYLFGSMIRGKAEPHDLDIMADTEKEKHIVMEALRLIGKEATTGKFREIEEKVTPIEFLEKIFSNQKNDSHNTDVLKSWLPDLEWGDFWLDYSHKIHATDSEGITNKVIFLGTQFKPSNYGSLEENHMAATAFVEIWSPQKPDVKKNYSDYLNSDTLRENIILEMNGIETQIAEQWTEMEENRKETDLDNPLNNVIPQYASIKDIEKLKEVSEFRRELLKMCHTLKTIFYKYSRQRKYENYDGKEIIQSKEYAFVYSVFDQNLREVPVPLRVKILELFGFDSQLLNIPVWGTYLHEESFVHVYNKLQKNPSMIRHYVKAVIPEKNNREVYHLVENGIQLCTGKPNDTKPKITHRLESQKVCQFCNIKTEDELESTDANNLEK